MSPAFKEIPTMLQNLSVKEREDFSPSAWKQRRRIIFWTLIVCAGCFIGVTTATLASMILTYFYPRALTFDQNLLGLASAIVWASVSTATTIIMGYVFGANMDTKDYRKTLANLPLSQVPLSNTTQTVTVTSTEEPILEAQTSEPVPDYVTEANQGEGPKG